jgi:hypothetical protein
MFNDRMMPFGPHAGKLLAAIPLEDLQAALDNPPEPLTGWLKRDLEYEIDLRRKQTLVRTFVADMAGADPQAIHRWQNKLRSLLGLRLVDEQGRVI